MQNLKILKTKTCGKGLFTNKSFKKNEFVFEFKGKIVDWIHVSQHGLQISKNRWIEPSSKDFGRYLNHSCNPTCGIKNNNKIVAIKNLKKNEHITIDYSTNTAVNSYELDCFCSEKNCRKKITAYKNLPNKLKAKYKKYTSEFLLD